MLGDHMQLPPVCELSDKFVATEPKIHSAALWDIPSVYISNLYSDSKQLLEDYYSAKLRLPSIPKVKLAQTFRFGSSLSDVLGKYVYNFPLLSMCTTDTNLYYIDAADSRTNNRISPSEAEAIKKVIYCYPYSDEQIAVLSPYTKQVNYISKLIAPAERKPSILTVHKSQGQEWDTVILSVVDGRYSRKWFTSSKIPKSHGTQLINTAISRARKRIILVLDKTYWGSPNQKSELISVLLSRAKPWFPNNPLA